MFNINKGTRGQSAKSRMNHKKLITDILSFFLSTRFRLVFIIAVMSIISTISAVKAVKYSYTTSLVEARKAYVNNEAVLIAAEFTKYGSIDEAFSGLDPVNSKILQDVVTEVINEGRIVIFSSHQMSYVEEFCRDIAIIDKGNIALAGNLKDIKRQYGENQLVISDVNMGLDELSQIIKDNVSDIITETGRTREEIIVRNINGVSRADILKRMIACGIEIEHFETYKPSLNDIFVSLVGDDMEDDKVVDYKNNSNDDNSYNRDIVDELPQGESSEHKKSVEGGVR